MIFLSSSRIMIMISPIVIMITMKELVLKKAKIQRKSVFENIDCTIEINWTNNIWKVLYRIEEFTFRSTTQYWFSQILFYPLEKMKDFLRELKLDNFPAKFIYHIKASDIAGLTNLLIVFYPNYDPSSSTKS